MKWPIFPALSLRPLTARPELPYMDVGYGEHVRNIGRPVEGLPKFLNVAILRQAQDERTGARDQHERAKTRDQDE